MKNDCVTCKTCVLLRAELARLREAQSDQIKAHVHDAEEKRRLEVLRWEDRFDKILRLYSKHAGM